MTTTPKRLFAPSNLTASTAVYYTVPTSTTTVIKHLALHNTSSSPVEATIYIVPSGGTAGVDNQIFKRVISPLESIQAFPVINATLPSGTTIQALAATASVISIHGSGNEIT